MLPNKRYPTSSKLMHQMYRKYVPNIMDDSLSLYEQMIAVIEHINNLVKTSDSLSDEITTDMNELITEVNDIREFAMPENVIKVLKDWQTSGFLDVVISEALQWELDEYITTNEQDKLSLATQLQHITSVESFKINIPETDDTGRLQRAIDYAMENTGTLIIPSGKVYKISDTLKIHKSIRIIGQKGRNMYTASAIEYTGDGIAIEIINGTTSNASTLWGVTIEDLAIYKTFEGDGGTTGLGIRAHQISECEFRNLQITGFKVNMELTFSNIVTFNHCVFNHSEYNLTLSNKSLFDSFVSGGSNNHVNINDCNLYSATIAQLAMTNADNLHVFQCHFEMSPIAFLIDTNNAYLNSTFFRNVSVRDSNFLMWNVSNYAPYGHEPRLLLTTGSGVVNGLNTVFDNVAVYFKPATSTEHLNTLPKYAIEANLDNAVSVFQTTLRNVTAFGVQETFFKGPAYKLDIAVYDSIFIRKNIDGSGIEIPLSNPTELNPKGFLRDGNRMKLLNTINISADTTSNPQKGDFWFDGTYLRYSDGTTNKNVATYNGGATSERPSYVSSVGYYYFDTTLNKPIWWTGSQWVDATGASV